MKVLESISNVACPFCGKTVGPKTVKELRCEHCGKDLRVKICTK